MVRAVAQMASSCRRLCRRLPTGSTIEMWLPCIRSSRMSQWTMPTTNSFRSLAAALPLGTPSKCQQPIWGA